MIRVIILFKNIFASSIIRYLLHQLIHFLSQKLHFQDYKFIP